ncbi:MAG: hypothetical protein M3R08_07250 [Bacteroidota bacterium]|nr:hypothetical protein [Bacteroidota bacterium]
MMYELKNRSRQLLFAIAVLFTPVAFAQKGSQDKENGPERSAEDRTERMTEELSLSPDQAARMKLIHEEHIQKMKAIREQDLDKKARKAAMTEVREWHRAEIKQVLTDEQNAKMEELRKARKAKKKQSEHGKGSSRNRH